MSINSTKRSSIGVTRQKWTYEGRSAVTERSLLRAGARAMSLMVLLLCVTTLSPAQPTITIKEYPVGFPLDITAGPDGAMWFTNYKNIGRITPSGALTTYPLPNQNRDANRITAGPDGALWFTEVSPDAIGRITIDGAITEYPLPNPATGVGEITTGPDGALWFTEWSGGKIGRITTSGIFTEYPLPRLASTVGITTGADGAVWFTEANESGPGGHVGRITTSGTITEYLLPPPVPNWPNWGFTSIVAGPDGALWITEWVGHRILRLTTAGSTTEYDLAGCPMTEQAWICADEITVGPDGALWFTMFAANSIGRITTTGIITQYAIPTSNSQSSGIATGPDGSIWFAEHAGGKIGQAVIEQPDTTPPVVTVRVDPRILWPPDRRMVTVTVSGMITDIGSGVNLTSAAYVVKDEYGEVQPTGALTLGPGGSYSFTVLLQASRLGTDLNGRRYTVTVQAKDNAGNSGSKTSVVTVPHDRGN